MVLSIISAILVLIFLFICFFGLGKSLPFTFFFRVLHHANHLPELSTSSVCCVIFSQTPEHRKRYGLDGNGIPDFCYVTLSAWPTACNMTIPG
jgi:hypothetical protein